MSPKINKLINKKTKRKNERVITSLIVLAMAKNNFCPSTLTPAANAETNLLFCSTVFRTLVFKRCKFNDCGASGSTVFTASRFTWTSLQRARLTMNTSFSFVVDPAHSIIIIWVKENMNKILN